MVSFFVVRARADAPAARRLTCIFPWFYSSSARSVLCFLPVLAHTYVTDTNNDHSGFDLFRRFKVSLRFLPPSPPPTRRQVEVQPETGGGCEVHTSTKGAWGDLHLSAGWVLLPDVLGQPLYLSYCKAVDGATVAGSRRGR